MQLHIPYNNRKNYSIWDVQTYYMRSTMNMKWIDAIKKVLQEENRALHYEEIAEKILDRNYREKVGATPAITVVSVITTDINERGENSAFIRVGLGEYFLKQTPDILQFTPTTSISEEESDEEIAQVAEIFTERNIIKTFGMFWSRSFVMWKSKPKLLGVQQRGATPVDFASQVGIYLLHDVREVIYIGQAIQQPLAQRLYQHTSDRLEGRWDRFSWFGFKGVNQDGTLTDIIEQNISTNIAHLIDTLEAILIEAMEPRQNRKSGNSFQGLEFNQEKDTEISKRDMLDLLESMKSELIKSSGL